MRLLVFRIGALEWALEAGLILKLQRPVTPPPGGGPIVPGMRWVTVDGHPVPVFDLRVSARGADRDRDSISIVAQAGRRRLGLLVDEVSEVLQVTPEQLVRPPDHLAGQGFVRWLACIGPRILLVLSLDRFTL